MHKRFALLITVVLGIQVVSVAPCQGSGEIPSELKDVCVYHPDPAWWAQARRGMHGKGVFLATINPKNGEVTEVKVLRRTPFPQLDAEMVLTLFKWKFKPNTITHATVPFELILTGYVKEIH